MDYVKWIRNALAASGGKKTQAGIAAYLKKDPAQVTRMLKVDPKTGKTRRLQLDEVSKIAEYLGLPSPIAVDEKPASGNASNPVNLVKRPLTSSLRRYTSAHAGHGGAIIMDEVFEEITTPPTLIGVEGAYACYVHGDSMEPTLYAGDTVFCHPFRPIRRNDLVVLQLWEDRRGGPIIGLVKQFISEDSSGVTVKQHNPPESFTFERERVKQVNKVVHIDKQ